MVMTMSRRKRKRERLALLPRIRNLILFEKPSSVTSEGIAISLKLEAHKSRLGAIKWCLMKLSHEGLVETRGYNTDSAWPNWKPTVYKVRRNE